ncbi:MAG: pseudaminic acid synthase [Salinivirgaceae bacterium]
MERIFIIAELSANHNGSFETALKTVKAAKEIGADAIKIQTYTADTITLDCKKADFRISNGGLWDGYYLYDLYKEAYTPWEWQAEIFKLAKEEGIICFSSPFDKTAIDFLEELNNPIYKIASFEITDIPLIKYAASKGKPMIISTGIANEDDIQLAVNTCREEGNNDITLLKCTSAYPAPIEEANLIMIRDLAERFGVKVGLSDHSLGITLPITAVALGATVIEKHFILDKSIGGPDAAFSLDRKEFAQMIKAVREVEQAIGKIDYKLSEKQKISREHSRSLYAVSDIKAGEIFTDKNIRSIRPGFGMHPKHYWEVLGKTAKKDIKRGTALSFDLFI